mmetsp:Transcript_21413/g.64269  ORF Transcript_21413/g.64269 Transcript_21413/m.64269 type:complete len:209 (-) Transcript_21413:379-1005(-)
MRRDPSPPPASTIEPSAARAVTGTPRPSSRAVHEQVRRSQIRKAPSSSPLTARCAAKSACRERTGLQWASLPTQVPPSRSQRQTMQSSDALAARARAASTQRAVTGAVCSDSLARQRLPPRRSSQTTTLPSSAPLTARPRAKSAFTIRTAARCSRSIAWHAPALTSQRATAPSKEPETACSMPTPPAIERTAPRWPRMMPRQCCVSRS